MKTIVYLTKNIINGKIYIGVHDMENPDVNDLYLGDGAFANKPSSYNKQKTPFHAAICKYGTKNFRRTTIKVFDTRKEALELEALIVDENFIRLSNNYNVTVGGGYPPRHDKKVYQYSLNGTFLKEYPSIITAKIENNGYEGVIRKSIAMKTSFADSFWSFNKCDKIDISDYTITKYKSKVLVYNKELELLNEFESIKSAAKAYNFDPRSIGNAIFEHGSLHGLYFVPASSNIMEFLNHKKTRNYTNTTSIFQYDKNKNFIRGFRSIKEVQKLLNLKSHSRIIEAIKTEKFYHGFYWSYYKADTLKSFINIPEKPKKIAQIDKGKIIKIWDINECRKVYPNVIKVCRGIRKKTGGYEWKYTE